MLKKLISSLAGYIGEPQQLDSLPALEVQSVERPLPAIECTRTGNNDHYEYSFTALGKKIGSAQVSILPSQPGAFLHAIDIDKSERKQGYGTAAVAKLASIHGAPIMPVNELGTETATEFWNGIRQKNLVGVTIGGLCTKTDYEKIAGLLPESADLAYLWGALPATGPHNGKILDIGKTQVIQDIGRNKCVAWERSRLSGVDYKKGDIVSIDSKGLVTGPARDCEVSR